MSTIKLLPVGGHSLTGQLLRCLGVNRKTRMTLMALQCVERRASTPMKTSYGYFVRILAFRLQYTRWNDANAFAIRCRHLLGRVSETLDALAVFLNEASGCGIDFAGGEQGSLALDHDWIRTPVGVIDDQKYIRIALDIVEFLILRPAEN